MIQATGLSAPVGEPLVHWSPGVEVRIGARHPVIPSWVAGSRWRARPCGCASACPRPVPARRRGRAAGSRCRAPAARETGGWLMWSVQLRWMVTSPVAVGRSTWGRSRPRRTKAGCIERPVRAGHDPQLAGIGVGARDRDAHGHRAAPVGVAPEAAVLVPRHVGDALDHPDRLDQRLDEVAVGAGLAQPVAVVGEPAARPCSRSSASSAAVVGDCVWKYCMRTSRSVPSPVRAHHERPSPGA